MIVEDLEYSESTDPMNIQEQLRMLNPRSRIEKGCIVIFSTRTIIKPFQQMQRAVQVSARSDVPVLYVLKRLETVVNMSVLEYVWHGFQATAMCSLCNAVHELIRYEPGCNTEMCKV